MHAIKFSSDLNGDYNDDDRCAIVSENICTVLLLLSKTFWTNHNSSLVNVPLAAKF